MTTFTRDDDGEKFEVLFQYPAQFPIQESEIVIRPIAKPKYEVLLMGNVIQIVFNPKPTRDQAQLIKEACEALMEYIDGEVSIDADLRLRADAARALQKGAQ